MAVIGNSVALPATCALNASRSTAGPAKPATNQPTRANVSRKVCQPVATRYTPKGRPQSNAS